jgi:hypothetical protein
MTNTVRGDSTLVANGKSLTMRLTLGALAEIENGLGLSNLGDIATRMKSPATKDIAVVASALLRAGGIAMSPDDVLGLETDVGSLVTAITGAFGSATPADATKAAPAPLAGTPSSNSGSA